ncbi:MAG: B12-binding domain-containing radical SAM protein [Ignavibacteria bacterium]|nr:B12-binding domain-containing radical SAM protein [Ignavibacteria bacterium]
MSDILFANTYFLKHDLKEFRNMNLYAPLGTLYAAAYVMQKGYSAALFDTMLADSEEDLKASLELHKPKYMVIYDDTFNYLTKMCLTRMREAAFRMSEIAKEFGCTVIVSGSDSVDHLEKYFHHKVDFAICGEGEQTLGELLDYLQNTFASNEVARQSHEQSHPHNINGLAFLESGKITRTAPRKVLKELDTLPYPAWELVDLAKYRELWLKHHGYFSINLVTTRGCPFHCNWCAKPVYGQVYNSHSPQYIAGQVKLLKEKYSADHIWFCDDIFGLKPGWVKDFDEAVNKDDIKLPFKCLSRADLLLKEDNISHLANAGCESIWIGAESGSQKILDAMDKGTTIEEIYEATRLLKKHGIKTCFFLQFGYTGETMTEINQTIKMVNDLMPDDIGISVSYPLPGTKFYERVSSQMKKKHNWELSDDFEMMFDGTYSTEFYRVLHKRVHKEYRTRQLLHEPLKRFTSLWKLPVYAAGWMTSSRKLKTIK